MAKQNARLCPRQDLHAFIDRHRAVALDLFDERVAVFRHYRPDHALRSLVRQEGHALAQRNDRVKHAAGLAGKLASGLHGNRALDGIATSKKSLARGFKFHIRSRLVVGYYELRYPDCRVALLAVAPHGKDSLEFGDIFGVDKKFRERRMRIVRRRIGKRQFHIGRVFDRA